MCEKKKDLFIFLTNKHEETENKTSGLQHCQRLQIKGLITKMSSYQDLNWYQFLFILSFMNHILLFKTFILLFYMQQFQFCDFEINIETTTTAINKKT